MQSPLSGGTAISLQRPTPSRTATMSGKSSLSYGCGVAADVLGERDPVTPVKREPVPPAGSPDSK